MQRLRESRDTHEHMTAHLVALPAATVLSPATPAAAPPSGQSRSDHPPLVGVGLSRQLLGSYLQSTLAVRTTAAVGENWSFRRYGMGTTS
jgi:hypothetical protein